MKKNPVLFLCLSACLLILISLPLPYWTVIMSAPTYPERNLSMRVYPSYFEGDIQERDVVGNLVGVKVPPPIPEEIFVIVPSLLVILILLALAAGFFPKLLNIAAVMPWVILLGLTAWTQYSLYIFGHDLDPNRPLRYVDPFTPPVIGIKKIGTLLTYHLPHIGSFLLVTAGVLLVIAQRKYKKEILPSNAKVTAS